MCVQFTFASNAATIVGGCLVTNKYKLRMPAAFVSAFVISVSLYITRVCAYVCMCVQYGISDFGHPGQFSAMD